MAPFSLMSMGIGLLAKSVSYGLFSSVPNLARCTSVIPAIKWYGIGNITLPPGGPPKKPINGYMRFVKQQRPVVLNHYPGIKIVDLVKKIAQQWRTLSPEQKRPYNDASALAREQYKLDMQRFQAQLSPAQTYMLQEEKKEKLARRRNIRKKRELNSLGKPKRPRSAFNIFMSEHFDEAKGLTLPMKMKSLRDEWTKLVGHHKNVYMQLSEDDKVRYKNEMKIWEKHMVEIGRDDLIRTKKTLNRTKKADALKKTADTKKKAAAKAKTATKGKTASTSTAKIIATTTKKV